MTDLQTLIALAAKNPNIVAIGTEGSSNNPALQPDAWTDLDVTLFCQDPARENGATWIKALGDPTLVQHLTQQQLFDASAQWESWLTRYPGTRRVDFKLAPASDITAYLAGDHLNGIVWRQGQPVEARATDAGSHFLHVPNQADYDATVNELVWIAGNVVKGLSRRNLLYANEQFNQHLRPQLLLLLADRETLKEHGQFDPGVNGKNLWPLLTSGEKQQLAATYNQATLQATRTSLTQLLTCADQLIEGFAQAGQFVRPDWLDRAEEQLHDWLADDTLLA